MIKITEQERQILCRILHDIIPEYHVRAFGSRVKGNAKPFSDLDLAIMTDVPLPLEKHAELVEAFSDSDLAWKVDLVDWAATSDAFKQIINAHYEVLI